MDERAYKRRDYAMSLKITLKGIIDEDFVNYKVPSMVLMFPNCTFKCDKESGYKVCQNSELAQATNIEVDVRKLYKRFISNPITKAIVLQGLEPFDSFDDVVLLLQELRSHENDAEVVIYTGYNEDEISQYVSDLTKKFSGNLIIKYGRYVPNCKPHYDEVLGVKLSSDNQYAIRY